MECLSHFTLILSKPWSSSMTSNYSIKLRDTGTYKLSFVCPSFVSVRVPLLLAINITVSPESKWKLFNVLRHEDIFRLKYIYTYFNGFRIYCNKVIFCVKLKEENMRKYIHSKFYCFWTKVISLRNTIFDTLLFSLFKYDPIFSTNYYSIFIRLQVVCILLGYHNVVRVKIM